MFASLLFALSLVNQTTQRVFAKMRETGNRIEVYGSINMATKLPPMTKKAPFHMARRKKGEITQLLSCGEAIQWGVTRDGPEKWREYVSHCRGNREKEIHDQTREMSAQKVSTTGSNGCFFPRFHDNFTAQNSACFPGKWGWSSTIQPGAFELLRRNRDRQMSKYAESVVRNSALDMKRRNRQLVF